MRNAVALGQFLTVAVLGFGVPGIAFGQSPAAPPDRPPDVPPESATAVAEAIPAPALAPDYGTPPSYSQGGYGYPPPPEPMDGFHTHDGFFLRVQTGIGFSSLSSTTGGVKTTIGGGGLSLGAAMGGVIAHNLVLYGALFETDTVNPDVQMAGTSVSSQIADTSLQGIGPGVAYYFGHINLYLSGTLALARFWTHDMNGNQLDTSKLGLAFDFSVGKEWWVSYDWGLGIAAQIVGGSMKDQNDPTLTWSAGAFSLLFSATYN